VTSLSYLSMITKYTPPRCRLGQVVFGMHSKIDVPNTAMRSRRCNTQISSPIIRFRRQAIQILKQLRTS